MSIREDKAEFKRDRKNLIGKEFTMSTKNGDKFIIKFEINDGKVDILGNLNGIDRKFDHVNDGTHIAFFNKAETNEKAVAIDKNGNRVEIDTKGIRFSDKIFEAYVQLEDYIEWLEYDKEYEAYLTGEKKLDIGENEYVGLCVYGKVAGDVVVDLHCGTEMRGFGVTALNKEFADGDIEKMKKHFITVEDKLAEEEKIKAEELKCVEMESEESILDGKKVIIHSVKINGKIYQFTQQERYYGTVILDGVTVDDVNILQSGNNLNGDKEKAYRIVRKYMIG